MSCRATLSAVVLAGLAGAAAAQPAILPPEDAVPGRIAAHIYINVATGEVTINRTPPGAARIVTLFNNSYADCIGYWFHSIDNPARDPALGREPFGSAVVHWADIGERSLVTGYAVTYTTDMSGFGEPGDPIGIPGFNLVNTFFQNYEGDLDPGGSLATPIATVRVESLYGQSAWTDIFGDCASFIGICGAIAYVDLEGSGREFVLGDPDAGALDLDGNGLYDFGYSYQFEQLGTERGSAGACLVRPASFGGQGSATTAPDAVEWFNQGDGPFTGYAGRYWFGGGWCGQPVRPWASYYLELFGSNPTSGCEVVDFITDGVVDFSDYLAFLNRYDSGDDRVDLNDDGLVDFADYLMFLDLYDRCD